MPEHIWEILFPEGERVSFCRDGEILCGWVIGRKKQFAKVKVDLWARPHNKDREVAWVSFQKLGGV